jgi:hypothetical protein
MSDEFGKKYIAWCRFRLMSQYWPRVQRCVEVLSEEEVWWREHESNNSVGNLVLHLTGNLNQFVLAGIGGAPDSRNKDQEFAERNRLPKSVLLQQIHEALLKTDQTLAKLEPARLLTATTVQGRERPVFEILSIVVEHFALHTGQIIFITKLRTGKGLSL